MPQLAVLLALLAVLYLALRWFSRVSPAAAARGVKVAGLMGLVGVGLWLVLTGKIAGLLAVAAGLTPWIARALRLHAFWRMLRQFGIRMGGGQASAGNTSRVTTAFLEMELDHDTGALDGRVTAGRFAGRALAQLDRAQALELWADVQADGQSVQVLEAWLDRTWPDWRNSARPADPPPAAAAGPMTRNEAYAILGLAPGADAEAVKAAHRRLMRQVHPDHGGSTWLAARINQARDLLLGA